MSKEEEVRWDVFEENVRVLIERKLDINKLFVQEIRWKVFFKFLKDNLVENVGSNDHIKEIIESPILKSQGAYLGPIVSRERWVSYCKAYHCIRCIN
jgi:hypothetical protein